MEDDHAQGRACPASRCILRPTGLEVAAEIEAAAVVEAASVTARVVGAGVRFGVSDLVRLGCLRLSGRRSAGPKHRGNSAAQQYAAGHPQRRLRRAGKETT